MAANNTNEKPVTFGATIEGLQKPEPTLRPQVSTESNMSAHSTAAEKEVGIDHSNPFSAFYKHPEARRSMDDNMTQSKTHLDVNVHDLEAGSVPLSAATTQQPKVSVDGRVKECTMWPSRQAVMDKRKMQKRSRGCKLFGNLNSKQRLWVKIIIGLLIVAAATGLGVGISRAVGGGVWSGEGQSKPIQS